MTFRLPDASMPCLQSPNRGFGSVETICLVKNVTVGGFSGTGCPASGPAAQTPQDCLRGRPNRRDHAKSRFWAIMNNLKRKGRGVGSPRWFFAVVCADVRARSGSSD